MIRIKGGPDANKVQVLHVDENNNEVELTGISSIAISPLVPGDRFKCKLEFVACQLDIETEQIEE